MSAVVTSYDCQRTCLELKAIKRERVHGQRAVVRYHASRSSGEAPWRLNTRQLRRSGIRPVKRRLIDAGWSSLVAREAHNLEVVGSNPAPAIETPVSKSFRPRGFSCAAGETRRNDPLHPKTPQQLAISVVLGREPLTQNRDKTKLRSWGFSRSKIAICLSKTQRHPLRVKTLVGLSRSQLTVWVRFGDDPVSKSLDGRP